MELSDDSNFLLMPYAGLASALDIRRGWWLLDGMLVPLPITRRWAEKVGAMVEENRRRRLARAEAEARAAVLLMRAGARVRRATVEWERPVVAEGMAG